MYYFTGFFLKFKSNLLLKRFFFLLNAAIAMAILVLASYLVSYSRDKDTSISPGYSL